MKKWLSYLGILCLAFYCVNPVFAQFNITAADDFASAVMMNDGAHNVSIIAEYLTAESGEPAHDGLPAAHSAWVRFQAPFTGQLQLAVRWPGFPWRWALYQGDSLTNLISRAAKTTSKYDSSAGFLVQSNESYFLAIDLPEATTNTYVMTTTLAQRFYGQPTNTCLGVEPADITLEIVDTDASRILQSVYIDRYKMLNHNLIAVLTNAPYRVTFTNMPAGIYEFKSWYRYKNGSSSYDSKPIRITILPRNDQIQKATLISRTLTEGIFQGSPCVASSQTNAPTNTPPFSLWWQWQPDYSGAVELSFKDANNFMYEQLAVFEGEDPQNLRLLGTTQSKAVIRFTARTGQTFYITQGAFDDRADPKYTWMLHQETFTLSAPALVDTNAATVPPSLKAWQGDLTTVEAINSRSLEIFTNIDWYGINGTNQFLLESRTQLGVPLTWTPPWPGVYEIYAQGINTTGGVHKTPSLWLTVLPANDLFSRAALIPADTVLLSITNRTALAGSEPGEPAHAGLAAQHSLWWTWTPSSNGMASFTVAAPYKDTLRLAAYIGGTLTNLSLVASNVDGYGLRTDSLIFPALAGTNYYLALDGLFTNVESEFTATLELHKLSFSWPAIGPALAFGETNNIEIVNEDPHFVPLGAELLIDDQSLGAVEHAPYRWDWYAATGGYHTFMARSTNEAGQTFNSPLLQQYVGPRNDHFTNAIAIEGDPPWQITGNTAYSTWEIGEPASGGWPDSGSVWYRWVPGKSRAYSLHFQGPEGTELALFNGTSAANAQVQSWGGSVDSYSKYYFTEGEAIYFRMGRRWQSGGHGPFTLEAIPPAPNDDFANSFILEGTQGTFVSTNISASTEKDEPPAGLQGSLWWRWTAPENGDLAITASDSDCQVACAIFTGSDLSNLKLKASGNLLEIRSQPIPGWRMPNTLGLRVKKGVTYHLALGSGWAEGPTVGVIRGSYSLNVIPNLPSNDDFADAIPIEGATNRVSGDLTFATGESFEVPEGPRYSLWWRWTSPLDGAACFYAESTNFAPQVLIYATNAAGVIYEAYSRQWRSGVPGQGPFFMPVKTGDTFFVSLSQAGTAPPVGMASLTIEAYPLPPAPANDDFAGRQVITNYLFETNVVMAGASHETNEPAFGWRANYFEGSLWWTFTAPTHGRLSLSARAGNQSTVVALFRGSELTNLEKIVSQFHGPIVTEMKAGQTAHLYLAAACLVYDAVPLKVTFEEFQPMADMFSNSIHLEGTNLTVKTAFNGCSREAGEPSHLLWSSTVSSGETMWWSWTAPADGRAEIKMPGYDSFNVAVYTGPAVNQLVPPANRIRDAYNTIFAARQGTVYHLGVERIQGGSPFVDFTLQLLPFSTTPANDNFAQALDLGVEGSSMESNLGATREAGEPDHTGDGGRNKSLWWRFTMPHNGQMDVYNSKGTLRGTTLAVYAGCTVDTLARVASGKDYVTFTGWGGDTYYVAAETPETISGDIEVVVQARPPSGAIQSIPGDLVKNGSFELLELGMPTAEWSYTNAVGGRINETGADGRNSLILSGSALWQDIPTVPGNQYRLRLAVAGGFEGNLGSIQIYFGDLALPLFQLKPGYFANHWQRIEHIVTAKESLTRLCLTGADLSLDAVSLIWMGEPPSITSPPQNRLAYVGDPVSFQVEVLGSPPLTLFWLFNNAVITNAHNSILALPAVTVQNAGEYRVMVTNASGSVTSAPAILTVKAPASLEIVLQPSGGPVVPGQYFSLSVAAVGTEPLQYQWYRDDQRVIGATNRHLTFTSVGTGDMGTYHVVVSNDTETVTSLPATLTLAETEPGGGYIYFANFIPGFGFGINAPVYDIDGVTGLTGTAYVAQLYAGKALENLRPVGEPSPFTGNFFPGMWNMTSILLPNISAGQRALVQVRVWAHSYGESYEVARALGGKFGRSELLNVTACNESWSEAGGLFGLKSFNLQAGLAAFSVGQLELLNRAADRTLTWKLTGEPGFRYLVERQVDGRNWQPFQVFTNQNGSINFTDIPMSTNATAIYRSRILD